MDRDSILETNGPARAVLLAGLVIVAVATCGAPIGSQTSGNAALRTCGSVDDFYRNHPQARLWTKAGTLNANARLLQAKLRIDQGSGRTGNAERFFSEAFVRRVQALAAAPQAEILYVDDAVRPRTPCASAVLEQAAASPTIAQFLARLEAPNSLAGAILASQARIQGGSPDGGRDLALARSIGTPARAVVVDTTSARLWMIENGAIADTMKVIVGKPRMATPQMAALIKFAVLNPYWNVPPDLVRATYAPRIAKSGASYLARSGFEAVDRYGPAAQRIDPNMADWSDVIAGRRKIGVRQLPGPGNAMGAVKFMFPNKLGIYLHDTPHRWTFDLSDRRLSSGCVRVERAADLYRWLFGRDLPPRDPQRPEQRVHLPSAVPVYLVRFSEKAAEALAGSDVVIAEERKEERTPVTAP